MKQNLNRFTIDIFKKIVWTGTENWIFQVQISTQAQDALEY